MRFLSLLLSLILADAATARPGLVWQATRIDGRWEVMYNRMAEDGGDRISVAGLPVTLMRHGTIEPDSLLYACRYAIIDSAGRLRILGPDEGELLSTVPDYANGRFLVSPNRNFDPPQGERFVRLPPGYIANQRQLATDLFAIVHGGQACVLLCRPSVGALDTLDASFHAVRSRFSRSGRVALLGRGAGIESEIRVYDNDRTLLYRKVAAGRDHTFHDHLLSPDGSYLEYTRADLPRARGKFARIGVDLRSGEESIVEHSFPEFSLRASGDGIAVWAEGWYRAIDHYVRGQGWVRAWDSPDPWARAYVLRDGIVMLFDQDAERPFIAFFDRDGRRLFRIDDAKAPLDVTWSSHGLAVVHSFGQTSVVLLPGS